MNRALSTAIGLAVLLVAAQPAAARPHVFSMSAPARALHESASGKIVSAPLRPPRRFNLVGLSWRGRAAPRIAIRASEAGGGWTRWQPLAADSGDGPDPGSGEGAARAFSDPAWAGEGDRVQFRLSRPVAALRLHFVDVGGTAAPRRLHAAQSTPGAPPIVPRSGWNARACGPPRSAPFYGAVEMAFVHHTQTLNGYSRSQSPSVVLGICLFHRDVRGWNDIGYNFLVDRFGTIFEGRAGGIELPVIGAQTQGYNAHSTGVSVIGSFISRRAPAAALDSIAALLRWKLPHEGVPTTGSAQVTSNGGGNNRFRAGRLVTFARISGHRDADFTDCPGGALYAQLPQLRRVIGALEPDPALASTVLSLDAPALTQAPGPTRLSGRLALADGSPVAGTTLTLQTWRTDHWASFATVATDSAGGYSAALPARHSHFVRALYAGDSSHRESSSEPVFAAVAPAITLSSPTPSVPTGDRVLLQGTIAPPKGRVRIVLQRLVGGRYRKLRSISVPVRQGAFSARLRLPRAGTYRASARFGGDGSNAPARSAPVGLTASAPAGAAARQPRAGAAGPR